MAVSELKQKLDRLVEQRTIEASKKELTKKCTTIARDLGKPIIAHSVFGNYLPDVWQLDEDLVYDQDSIQEADDWNEDNRGFYFDGLRFGINLCIKTLFADNQLLEIKTTYNGYLVYAEIDGKLKSYAPFPLWEDTLEMFYKGAVQREKERTIKEKQKSKEETQKKWRTFWKTFRMLWGY